ncbi:MAG: hypothetical protein DRG78_06345 [Epsilonproteobacteria bacterium]|nr:MAG: hypothetical protein DRG78_06345 [Campylobacterota bacterium]
MRILLIVLIIIIIDFIQKYIAKQMLLSDINIFIVIFIFITILIIGIYAILMIGYAKLRYYKKEKERKRDIWLNAKYNMEVLFTKTLSIKKVLHKMGFKKTKRLKRKAHKILKKLDKAYSKKQTKTLLKLYKELTSLQNNIINLSEFDDKYIKVINNFKKSSPFNIKKELYKKELQNLKKLNFKEVSDINIEDGERYTSELESYNNILITSYQYMNKYIKESELKSIFMFLISFKWDYKNDDMIIYKYKDLEEKSEPVLEQKKDTLKDDISHKGKDK